MTCVRLISFDAFRTLGLPGVRYIKPELMQQSLDDIRQADWLLFPAYWQINSLHYVLKRRIFPSLASYHLGHDKVEMTRAFQAACPAHIPRTEILARDAAHVDELLQRWELPLVAKKIRASEGLGVYLIETRAQLADYIAANEVVYLQELLPIERDLRVVLVGRQVVAAYWREGADFHNNLARGGVVRLDLPIPQAALDFVTRLAFYLDIDHAGFDLALVGDHPYVLEFNRLFGMSGEQQLSERVAAAMRTYLGLVPPAPRQEVC